MEDAKFNPVEVLTREDVEKIVEEKLKKLLEGLEIKKKVAELESSVIDLRSMISNIPIVKPKVADYELAAQALLADLGERSKLLEIVVRKDSIMLRPKRYLETQDFRAVTDVVKKHDGFWSSVKRSFIIRKSKG